MICCGQRRSSCGKRALVWLKNLSDAVRVYPCQPAFTEMNDNGVVSGRADIPRLAECVLHTVIQPDGKWSKRMPLDYVFDLFHAHRATLIKTRESSKPRELRPKFVEHARV